MEKYGNGKKKGKNWSTEETQVLSDFVSQNSKVLFGAFDADISQASKARLWTKAMEVANSVGSNQRSVDQIKKWADMKEILIFQLLGQIPPLMIADNENSMTTCDINCTDENTCTNKPVTTSNKRKRKDFSDSSSELLEVEK
ncbi:t-SNARE domain-containing protein 1 [Mactra antiquata]